MTHHLPPEVRALTEDDIYRTSSQFRVWSFSPESLAARRTKTHEIAIERIERQRNNGANNALDNGQNNGEKLDYLTEHEELRLVQKYCDMIRATNDNLSWPANVKVREPCYPYRHSQTNIKPRRPAFNTCAASTSPIPLSHTRPKKSTKPHYTSQTKPSPTASLSPNTPSASPPNLRKSLRQNTKSYKRYASHWMYGNPIEG